MRTTPLLAAILTPALLLSTIAGCAQSTNTQTSSGSATSWSTATRAGAWRPNTNAPDIERFTKLRAPGGALLSPDGRLFVRDLPDGITQVYSASRI
ncbi:MAG: hypothetical protein SFY95_05975, partial [Planctomycetota bacterium]|nr:hypothetical protein [Planctomycetota bacterium]